MLNAFNGPLNCLKTYLFNIFKVNFFKYIIRRKKINTLVTFVSLLDRDGQTERQMGYYEKSILCLLLSLFTHFYTCKVKLD